MLTSRSEFETTPEFIKYNGNHNLNSKHTCWIAKLTQLLQIWTLAFCSWVENLIVIFANDDRGVLGLEVQFHVIIIQFRTILWDNVLWIGSSWYCPSSFILSLSNSGPSEVFYNSGNEKKLFFSKSHIFSGHYFFF